MGTKVKESVTGHRRMHFPPFITLAMSVTRCHRCPGHATVLATVIDGCERRLDPLPLSPAGLAAAVAARRWVAVVNPVQLTGAHPIAHRAAPGHWWLRPIGGGPPTLLVEHQHDTDPLPFDPGLAAALLTRLLPADVQARPDDAPPPF